MLTNGKYDFNFQLGYLSQSADVTLGRGAVNRRLFLGPDLLAGSFSLLNCEHGPLHPPVLDPVAVAVAAPPESLHLVRLDRARHAHRQPLEGALRDLVRRQLLVGFDFLVRRRLHLQDLCFVNWCFVFRVKENL